MNPKAIRKTKFKSGVLRIIWFLQLSQFLLTSSEEDSGNKPGFVLGSTHNLLSVILGACEETCSFFVLRILKDDVVQKRERDN